MEEAWKAIRVMRYPSLLEAYQTGFLGFPEPMDLNGKKLQVIVKLANILLVRVSISLPCRSDMQFRHRKNQSTKVDLGTLKA